MCKKDPSNTTWSIGTEFCWQCYATKAHRLPALISTPWSLFRLRRKKTSQSSSMWTLWELAKARTLLNIKKNHSTCLVILALPFQPIWLPVLKTKKTRDRPSLTCHQSLRWIHGTKDRPNSKEDLPTVHLNWKDRDLSHPRACSFTVWSLMLERKPSMLVSKEKKVQCTIWLIIVS